MPAELLDPPNLPPWLASQVPDNRYRVDLGEYRMHVMETGDRNGRVLLMVHGNPTLGFLYRRIVGELSGDQYRIVLPDLIGLGFSDTPRDPAAHRLDSHQRWLGALIEALDLRDVLLVVQDWAVRSALARSTVSRIVSPVW